MLHLRKQHTYRAETDGEGDKGGGDNAEAQAQTAAPEVEEKARKMGWTPKEEFRGDPDKWRGAAEFVERGENMLPIVRKTVEKQEREIADLKKSIKEFSEYHTKTEQRAYERALKDLKTKQIEAVAAADTATFVEIDKEIAELNKDISVKPKASDEHPDYKPWLEKNKWAEDDTELAAYAEGQAVYLRKKGVKVEGAEFLDMVAERVKKEFPDKFSNPRRNSAPSVEGATNLAKRGGGRTYADLPAEARAACDRAVKNYGIKKEDYVKNYDWEA